MSESYPLPYVSNDLTGRVAFVTGASSGLGRRFALTLAAAGAKVAATARRVDKLEELAEEVAANGGECVPIALDVTDPESITHAVAHANEALGLVDILVNNAGIPDAQRAHKMSLELTDAVLDTNLRGPWLLANEVARGLLAAKKPGRIVNIASLGAFNYGGNGAALYSISKMAIHRMTETLAVEWSRYNINVNCIAPGAFASEMMDGMLSRMGDITQAFPRKRLLDPALLDSTLLYLVSPASEAVTGTTIKVDDGQGSRQPFPRPERGVRGSLVTRIAVVAHQLKLQPADRRALEDALFMAGMEAAWTDIPKAKQATKAAKAAVAEGAEVVIACGGDGTVRAASEALVGTDAALAVLPAGTANLFAGGFGLPSTPADLVAVIAAGTTRTVDSGICNDLTFNVMAGAGFDARMIDDADDSKERLGMLAYIRAGLHHARGGDRFDAQVTVDGEPFFAGPAACVLVANLGTLKAGVAAFPDASPTDGRLDVGVVTAAGLRQWAAVLAKTVRRKGDESPHTTIRQGAAIEVRLDGKHRYELDGGCKGTTKKLSFSVRPGALRLCAPAS